MQFKHLLIVMLAMSTIGGAVSAQNTPPAPKTPPKSVCLTDENFRAFDFWIGDWVVTGRKAGKFAGNNSIKSVEGGCALLETWKGTGGSTGISTNHYNPNTGKWQQLWLSGGAYTIDIVGGIEEGSMVLVGKIFYYRNGKTFDFKGTWTPLEDGTVRQFFEQHNPEKQEWQPWFDGIYTRAESKAE